MDTSTLPDLKHCYCKYTLKEAVEMVQNSAQIADPTHELETIEEVLDHLKMMIDRSGFNWITGQRAKELIIAFMEGKDIEDVAIA